MRDSYLRAALKDARVSLDERGLMPLEQARALVARTRVFERGEAVEIEGTVVEDADRVWAALMSLEDGAEFVRQGERISWAYMVRGHHNIAPVERYGHAVLPWIAYAVNDKGALTNVPWCRVACLLELRGEEAYRLAARVKEVRGSKRSEFTDTVIAPEGPMLDAWIRRHPDEGVALLGADAQAGERWAQEALKRVARIDPAGALAALAAGIGEEAAGALAKTLGLRPKRPSKRLRELLDAAEVVDAPSGPPVSLLSMDGHFLGYRKPSWFDEGALVTGMRATGFAHTEGDALVFQSLRMGGAADGIQVDIHAYGPGLSDEFPGLVEREQSLVGDELLPERLTDYPLRAGSDGVERVCRLELRGVAREVPLPEDKKPRRDLDPRGAILAALARPPLRDEAFLDAEALAQRVGLPSGAVEIFTLDGWLHPDDKPASSSPDLVAMVTALRARRRITSLPKGKPDDASLKRRLRDLGWSDDDALWNV